MKICPACGKRGETDTTRFCGSCGTELFFENRYEKPRSERKGFSIFKAVARIKKKYVKGEK